MPTFKEFLDANGITPERLLRTSMRIEASRPEDRVLRVARKQLRIRRAGDKAGYSEAGIGKPRSGRGVGEQSLLAALHDRPLPSAVRSKLVRAVNALIARSGSAAVDARALFGAVPSARGARAASPE